MKLNVAIFSIWFSVGMPSFVMGQGATERADSVPTRYEKMMARRMEGWKRLIPDHYKIQFAGSIGAASIVSALAVTCERKCVGDSALVMQFVLVLRVKR